MNVNSGLLSSFLHIDTGDDYQTSTIRTLVADIAQIAGETVRAWFMVANSDG